MLDILAEQNIGNGTILQPQAGSASIIPNTNPERILMLSGPSSAGQTTSIALTASRIVGPNNPNPGFSGPITGIIEFGNGGQFTRAEVDIPIGPFAGSFNQASAATEPQDGGVIVTVPTGVLRVYARYDNLLIRPILGLPPLSLAQAQVPSVPFVGPGGPTVLDPLSTIPAEPVLVKAMAAYFSRHTSKVYKTTYCYNGTYTKGGAPTPIDLGGSQFCVPAFARSLKVLRTPITSAVYVALYDNACNQLDFISVPSGSAPIIPIAGNETIVQLITPSAGDKVYFLALLYEIGI